MYAIIETGGRQYRVEQGDLIDVEIFSPVGVDDSPREVQFDRVLMVGSEAGVRIGNPVLDGALVSGSVVADVRDRKVLVFKKKRRKGYKRLRGHRQDLQRVLIGEIRVDG